jgi:hypothetical protein
MSGGATAVAVAVAAARGDPFPRIPSQREKGSGGRRHSGESPEAAPDESESGGRPTQHQASMHTMVKP